MKRGVFLFWALLIAVAVIRFGFSFDQNTPDLDGCLRQDVGGKGLILNEPERKETGQVFIAKTELCGAEVFIRMKTKLYPRLLYGDQISFIGKVSKPFNFSSDSGREFNYKGYLAKEDVFYEIKSASVEKIGDSEQFSITGGLYALKRGFVSNLEKVLGDPHAALAAGLVVGEKSALGKDLLDAFRTVGLIHIIVLSGYNITIVADSLRKILTFLPRTWGIAIGGIGIGLFGVLVGGGATVVRSCFMAAVALAGDLIRRDYNVVRALFLAGFLMLIQNPLILLYDPSFQLSFLATLGLIILAGPIESRISWITEHFGIRGIIASTLATQILVSPYILYMMGSLSIIGMVVNILVLPVIPLTMLMVFLAGATGFILPALSMVFGWASNILLSYELFIVNAFSRFPLASVELPPFSGWFVAAFYTAVFLCMIYFSSGQFRGNSNVHQTHA
jgi:competence protein ComEC